MRPILYLILPVFLAPMVISCSKENQHAPAMKHVDLTQKQKQLIESSNAFGFDLFRHVAGLSGSEKNLMISPLSVSMALGMTRNGASGITLEAMNTAMGMQDLTDQEINESFRFIMNTFSSLDPAVKISIANSIWYRNSLSVLQPFIDLNKTYFNSDVTALNFEDPASVAVINSWVKERTNNLIPKIIDQIPAEMVMYLINAVYFKGQWKYQFETKNTADKPFYPASGIRIDAPAMLQRADLPYMHTDGFSSVELPYNQGNFAMNILLPDAEVSVNELVTQITPENWAKWTNKYIKLDVQLQLPKFKFSYDEKNLKEALSVMGMGVAFDEYYADFTRINPEGNLYISEIKHKTYIETNEEGTEAAAVTSVGVGTTSIGTDPEPVVFTVDRPFVFILSEKSTGTLLFMGIVMNPLD